MKSRIFGDFSAYFQSSEKFEDLCNNLPSPCSFTLIGVLKFKIEITVTKISNLYGIKRFLNFGVLRRVSRPSSRVLDFVSKFIEYSSIEYSSEIPIFRLLIVRYYIGFVRYFDPNPIIRYIFSRRLEIPIFQRISQS